MRKLLVPLLLVASSAMADELWLSNEKAKSFYKKGDFEKALELFDSASVQNPGAREVHFNRALTLAQLGRVGEAKKILGGLEFADSTKSAELAYTKGKVADIEGDAAIQKQDINGAKKAYTEALQHYVDALTEDSTRTDALKNVELTGSKLVQLPEPPEDDQNQDQNQDNKDQDQNQDENQDQKDDQNKDDQNQDENQDQNKDDQDKENEDDQDKDQNEDENQDKEDEKDDQKDDQNDQNEDQQDQQPPQPEQPDSVALNAMQLLEKYADDANDLNKPPVGKAQPVAGGKDW